jgi:O-antigen ligase
MPLRLKEDPREWLKFALVWSMAMAAVAALLWLRGTISRAVLFGVLALLWLALASGVFRPQWLRPPYRCGMTASFFLGQVAGRILLLLVFLFVLVPLGLLLRLLRKDLLGLKRRDGATTYWRPARATDRLDTQF